jgi:hypothetical protein
LMTVVMKLKSNTCHLWPLYGVIYRGSVRRLCSCPR